MGEYRCILLEQRGHGRSGRSIRGRYSLADFSEECAAFLDATIGPAVLVGQSQGGHVVFGAAASRPDLVKAIYSEDSVPSIAAVSRARKVPIFQFLAAVGQAAEIRERDNLSVAEYARMIGQQAPFGTPLAETSDPLRAIHFARAGYFTDPAFYRVIGGVEDWAWSDEVAEALPSKIRCPVHLAHGNRQLGSLVPQQAVEALLAVIPTLTSTYFERGGHEIHGDVPREFIADLKSFLSRVS